VRSSELANTFLFNKHQQEDLGASWRIILKWILEKYNGIAWAMFIWLPIAVTGWLL
jgi:hypothetical protein